MAWLPDYVRSAEGRWLVYGIVVVAFFDLSLRLFPSVAALPSEFTGNKQTLFERREPSAEFNSWVAERREIKNAEIAKAAQALTEKEAVEAPVVDQKVFVDTQSGKLRQFQIGNFKYRLWGVFSVSKQKGKTESTFAVLRPDSGASRIVTVGDAVGGYTVKSVEDRSVNFEANDGRMVELELFERRG